MANSTVAGPNTHLTTIPICRACHQVAHHIDMVNSNQPVRSCLILGLETEFPAVPYPFR